MMKFVATHDDQTVEYLLKEGINVVGRDQNCDILIDHPQVSRNHISVMVGPEGVVIQDLNSRNGTFVNGLRVKNTAQIKQGDTVALGRYLMKFVVEAPLDLEEEPPTPVSVEPQEEGVGKDTLPFKGKYAKMMGGEPSATLPAKFDPSHYQVEMHGQRITVTDSETGQAMELYRGTPDAAILERLIDERRRRERRNLILGVTGGIIALVVLIVLAAAVFRPEPKKSRPKFDKKAYYGLLNQAVKAFQDRESPEQVEAILARAEKVPHRPKYVSYDVQLKNIFRLKRELKQDKSRGEKWAEILTDIGIIEDNPLPEEMDVGVIRGFVEAAREEAKREKKSWTLLKTARAKLGKFKQEEEEKAIKELRGIETHSVYYDEAREMIATLTLDIANRELRSIGEALGKPVTLDNLKDVKEEDLDMRTVDVWIDAADKLLKNTYFRNNEDRKALDDFIFLCETFQTREENKNEAVRLAREHLENGDIEGAWNKVKYLENDETDEARYVFVQGVKKKHERHLADLKALQKVQDAIAEVIKAYNTGRGEEALVLIEEYRKEGLAAEEWLILQNRISRVVKLFEEARTADKGGDVLLAKQNYENIIALEDSEANHYRQQAEKFLTEFEQGGRDVYVRGYMARARTMIKDKNYLAALDAAKKADLLVGEDERQPGIEIRIEVNQIGDRKYMRGFDLHAGGEYRKALQIFSEILEKHIYADDGKGIGIANATRDKREDCRRQLGLD